jgi:enoyl-CoA hydratase/3-hydroxyacyl-CoA dehydrogenase
VTIEEIQTVCFVGAGSMGCFNSIKAAISGYDVVLYDIDEENLRQSTQRHQGFADFLVASGYCSGDDIPAALERISLVTDLEQATAGADLVSESVFERLDIKRDVHRKLDETCPPKTILTSNSSYLLLSQFEDVVQRGDRIAALHSYMASPLMDIVGGPRTSGATVDILKRYVESTHAEPLVLNKEYRGYVLNAVLGPVLGTAMFLLIEGLGECEAVDRAWMRHRHAPMGPLGMLDMIGLGPVYDSWLHREDEGPIPGLRPGVLQLLSPMLERGAMGMQAGSGFYQYPEPAYQKPDFLEAGPDREDLYGAMELALVGSAVLVAAHNVADPADIDRAWMVGTSLDTGPFALLEKIGTAQFKKRFSEHVAMGRFNPENARLVMDYLG